MAQLKKLLLSAKTGDEEAFERLVETFRPLLNNVSFRPGTFDEDCYQECLIALHRAIEKFEVR